MVHFWSLSRSGLAPVEGRGSWRLFWRALGSVGFPRLVVVIDGNRTHRFVIAALEFWSPSGLFRCSFTVRSFPWRRRRSLW